MLVTYSRTAYAVTERSLSSGSGGRWAESWAKVRQRGATESVAGSWARRGFMQKLAARSWACARSGLALSSRSGQRPNSSG